MSWNTLIDALRICPSFDTLKNRGDVESVLAELAQAAPEVYWYPGSGNDMAPVLFDTPANPVGQRLYPLLGEKQNKPLVLWMSDYLDCYANAPSGFNGVFSNVDEHGLAPRFGLKVDVERTLARLTVPLEPWSSGDRDGDKDPWPKRPMAVPLTLFQVRATGGQGRHRRPESGDLYTVVFSLAESEILLRHVFVPHQIPIRVVALERQGGFSGQRRHFDMGNFEQYRDVPRLLRQHETEVGRVQAYLCDHDIAIPGYQPTDLYVKDWGIGGTRMWSPVGDHSSPLDDE